jgi:1-acyl-sn-glycerol-3-phosphate acyltransferase
MLIFLPMKLRAAFIAARSLIFIPLVTVTGSAVGIVLSFFTRDGQFIYRNVVKTCSWMILRLAGLKVTVAGIENIPPGGEGCITVFNHQSHLDIPVIAHSLPIQLRFIGKKELRRAPVFGAAIIRMGHFLIDRSDHQSALRDLKDAAESIRQKGLSLAFAPEGTRSPDGGLLPFKKGAFVLSIETGLPILPVTIDGTARCLPKKSLMTRSGSVTVTIHPLVRPTGLTYGDRDDYLEKIRNIIELPLNTKAEY